MKNKITIVGNGNIGQAIFYLLQKSKNAKKYKLEIFDKDIKKNKSKKSLEECVSGADFIFLCIPSWVEEEALKEMSDIIDKNTILVSLSKGINMATKKSVDGLIESDIKNAKYALLSGPMFAEEIKKNMPSFAVLATSDKKNYRKISSLFAGTTLRLEYSKEVHSVAISAVLKNIYTLLFGIIDSFKDSNNLKGFLATKSLYEMSEIMKRLGLKEKVVYEISGLGDFIATAESHYSRNRKVGIEIYKKGKAISKSEGLVSLFPFLKILGKKSKNLPLLSLLERIIISKKDPKKEMEKFFKNL